MAASDVARVPGVPGVPDPAEVNEEATGPPVASDHRAARRAVTPAVPCIAAGVPVAAGRVGRAEARRRLAAIARRQYGIVTVSQAIEVGVGRTTVHRFVVDGHLVKRLRGVYAVNGAPDTREARWFAALAAAGPHAALSHRTAATFHGLEHGLPNDAVHLVVPRLREARWPGVQLHEARKLLDNEVVRSRSLRVTSPARTVADLAAELHCQPRGAEQLREVVGEVVRRRLAGPEEIRVVLQRRQRLPGRTDLRRVLDELSPLEPRSRSALESRFLTITSAAGVGPTAMNHPVTDGDGRRRVLDAVWLPTPVFAELDSQAHHGTWADRNDDLRRENALALSGFTVCLRFTWQHLHDDPRWVVDTVRRALVVAEG